MCASAGRRELPPDASSGIDVVGWKGYGYGGYPACWTVVGEFLSYVLPAEDSDVVVHLVLVPGLYVGQAEHEAAPGYAGDVPTDGPGELNDSALVGV